MLNKKIMQKTKVIGTVIIIIIALAVFIEWTSKRDEKIMIAADKYEECVREEYGMSPSKWYAEHGEYPTCDFTINK
jgi:hypothetical protein